MNNQSIGTTYTRSSCNTRQYLLPVFGLSYQNGLSINFQIDWQSGTCNFPIGGSNGNYVWLKYLQIASTWCPTANPYYRLSDNMCYSTCPAKTYTQTANSTCFDCRYDCYTCSSTLTTCLSCSATTDFRVLNGTSCIPMPGYY